MTYSSSETSVRAAAPPFSRDLVPGAVDEAGMPVRIVPSQGKSSDQTVTPMLIEASPRPNAAYTA